MAWFPEGILVVLVIILIIIIIITGQQETVRNYKNSVNSLGCLSKIHCFERGNQPFHEIHRES